jgi:hypothetical protein
MRVRVAVAVVIALLTATACGGGGEDRAADDRAAVVKLAKDYVAAFARSDAAATCATRTRSEQRELERTAGSCRAAMALVISTSVKRYGEASLRDVARARPRPEAVKVDGDEATIAMTAPLNEEPLHARRDGDRWGLYDYP